MEESAKAILSCWSAMVGERSPWDSLWQEAADFSLPRKGTINRNENGPGRNSANALYDTTAIEACGILASGHSAAITPMGSAWFSWEAPEEVKSDEADAWYNMASERALKVLASGNCYTSLQECFEDRSGFGIGFIGAMPSPERKISFQAHPVGSFCIEENSDGDVDTVYRYREYSIRQLVQLFGEAVVTASPKLSAAWQKFRDKGIDTPTGVIHAVFPRLERAADKTDALSLPWASVWITDDGKTTLQRSGFAELPYCVTRYLRRTGSRQQYGYGPFEQVRAAVEDAQKLKQILRVVGQKIAVPPIIVPENLIGNVDTRPGGRTVVRANSMLPTEWLTKGNPDGLFEQLQDARATIRAAYHTDLFKMFSDREKQMTAREVSELAAEKLMPFSPSFTRFTADFRVMMERIFAILFRAGSFGTMDTIPAAVIIQTRNGREVPPPKIVYQSRIALAIRQTESAAGDRMVERAIGVAQIAPEVFDNIDLDAWIKGAGRNDGVSEAWIVPEKTRDERRQKRAEAQAQQQQLEQAKLAAEAAQKAGIQAPTMEA